MKKFMAALLSAALLFAAVGTTVLISDPASVEAKGYKSGKKGFNFNNNQQNQKSNIQKKDTDSTAVNKSNTTTNNKGFSSGGLMRGLFVGGLAGLLFGSLFANMGMLGSVLGLLINVLGILVLLWLIKTVFTMLIKKRDEDSNPWRN
ncbi:hypothetical protein ACFOZY_06650 [Chungangia koreensis]|uniref:Preprotein translocase subunit Tim44 n=1 Tax=Chungangia koreensis TaxID=752657 RepID=A0ABV8X2H7_9LACT